MVTRTISGSLQSALEILFAHKNIHHSSSEKLKGREHSFQKSGLEN